MCSQLPRRWQPGQMHLVHVSSRLSWNVAGLAVVSNATERQAALLKSTRLVRSKSCAKKITYRSAPKFSSLMTALPQERAPLVVPPAISHRVQLNLEAFGS